MRMWIKVRGVKNSGLLTNRLKGVWAGHREESAYPVKIVTS